MIDGINEMDIIKGDQNSKWYKLIIPLWPKKKRKVNYPPGMMKLISTRIGPRSFLIARWRAYYILKFLILELGLRKWERRVEEEIGVWWLCKLLSLNLALARRLQINLCNFMSHLNYLYISVYCYAFYIFIIW